MRPDYVDRPLELGSRQQMVDHCDQPIVEIGVRVAKIVVGLLKQGIEALLRMGSEHAARIKVTLRELRLLIAEPKSES